jgi:hypothetical protein
VRFTCLDRSAQSRGAVHFVVLVPRAVMLVACPAVTHMHAQSPQVISSKTTKQGYDAQKADVWACGVLLFVMLLGMFPFEHEGNPDPNSSQAHVEVRCEAGCACVCCVFGWMGGWTSLRVGVGWGRLDVWPSVWCGVCVCV